MVDINTNPQNVNIIPFQKSEIAENKQEYIDAIHHWCKTHDLAETLSRQELGAMKAFDRIDAQRKAIILHLSKYYRKHKRADVAPGVLVIMTLLSDNEKGSCSLSQRTLSEFFGCHESTIREAQSRLKDCNAIVMGRGRYAANYPVIPRVVTEKYNHLVWTVAALNSQPKHSNVPTKAADCQSADKSSGMIQCADKSSGLNDFNPPTKTPPYNSLKNTTTTRTCEDNVENKKYNHGVKAAAGVIALGLSGGTATLPAAANPIDPPAIVRETPDKLTDEQLRNKLLEAGGEALAEQLYLATTSEPRNWMIYGCDLEEDIIPTIKASAARKGPRSISTWGYFTKAIFEAKDKRLAPRPVNKFVQRKSYQEELEDKTKEWLEKEIAENKKRFAGRVIEPRSEQ